MNITTNADLRAYIDPLTPDEHAALERSLLAEGCRDALVLWGDVLVDGHNRHGICLKHGLAFQTVQNPRLQSMEDVQLWMIDQHLGRRSVSDFQRGVLALRKREIEAQRRSRAQAEALAPSLASALSADPPGALDGADLPAPKALQTREDIARAARLSSGQVVMIEKIQKNAVPELVDALKSGAISLNAAAAVASLPAQEQTAAALAGKDGLKQLAKRVRESRRKAPDAIDGSAADPALGQAEAGASAEELLALRHRVAELEAENALLRSRLLVLGGQHLG